MSLLWRFVVAMLLVGIVLAVRPGVGSAQSVDFWKESAANRDTVSRFVYRQAPQAIPSTYDPVIEAESYLRQSQSSLSPSNPQARELWRLERGLVGRSGLSVAARGLGWVGLGVVAGEVGWKIGSGINAKWLRIGLPEQGGTLENEQLEFLSQGATIFPGYGTTLTMPFDGWVWTASLLGFRRSWWFHGAPTTCVSAKLIEPDLPEGLVSLDAGQLHCKPDGFPGNQYETRVSGLITASAMPEEALAAPGPIEDYTNQSYERSSSAPSPVGQSTLEDNIETTLELPEYALLRQWLNYMLGSPGEDDPLGIGAPNSEIPFPDFFEKFDEHWDDFDVPYSDPIEYRRGAKRSSKRGTTKRRESSCVSVATGISSTGMSTNRPS